MSTVRKSVRVGAAAFVAGLSLAGGPQALGVASADGRETDSAGISAGPADQTAGAGEAAPSKRSAASRTGRAAVSPADAAERSATDVADGAPWRSPRAPASASATAAVDSAPVRRLPRPGSADRAELPAAASTPTAASAASSDGTPPTPAIPAPSALPPLPALPAVPAAAPVPVGNAAAPPVGVGPGAAVQSPHPRALSTAAPSETARPARAGIVATALVRLAVSVDRAADQLSGLPASPLNAFLAGALQLVRRTLLPNIPDTPALSVGNAEVLDGDGPAMFTVTLDKAYDSPITLGYTTSSPDTDNAATPGADYTPVSGLLTFAPGETTKGVPVPITGGGKVATPKIFTLAIHPTLGSPEAAVLVDRVTLIGATGLLTASAPCPAAASSTGGGCGPSSTTPIPNTIKVSINRAPTLTYSVERWIAPINGEGGYYRRPGAVITPRASDPDGEAAEAYVASPPAAGDRVEPVAVQREGEGFRVRVRDDGRLGNVVFVVATDGIDTTTANQWIDRGGAFGSFTGATPPADLDSQRS